MSLGERAGVIKGGPDGSLDGCERPAVCWPGGPPVAGGGGPPFGSGEAGR